MQRVLLVCLDNLGDLIFVSAIADAMRQDPDKELSLWCKDYTAQVGQLLPSIHQVFAADPFWDKSPGRPKGSWTAFFRCWRAIRQQRFDRVLIASACWRTAMFLCLAGIPERVGLQGRKNQRFLTTVVEAPTRKEPVVAGLLSAFKKYLPPTAGAQTRLDPERFLERTLPEPLAIRPYLCIHAFAGRRDRCAPLEILLKLASTASARGLSVLWLGTAVELKELRSQLADKPHQYYADQWAQDLLSTVFFISRAQAFIGHDSGPLHVAGALAVPVLGFYLPGEPERTMPQGRAASILVVRQSPQHLDQSTADEALEKLLQVL